MKPCTGCDKTEFLQPDAAGYHRDSYREDGAPLLCMNPECPRISQKELEGVSNTKLSNPKDTVGSDKMMLHLWPMTATAMGTLGLIDGALKYGRSNWRAVGIRASIYYDALTRHMSAWFEGEDTDPDSGLPHLAHAMATLAIVVDAMAAGKFNDDRMLRGGYRAFIDEMTAHVPRLKQMREGCDPRHYTIKDNEEVSNA